eukprot:167533-Lingulodinium_polyedra.AAC.1
MPSREKGSKSPWMSPGISGTEHKTPCSGILRQCDNANACVSVDCSPPPPEPTPETPAMGARPLSPRRRPGSTSAN